MKIMILKRKVDIKWQVDVNNKILKAINAAGWISQQKNMKETETRDLIPSPAAETGHMGVIHACIWNENKDGNLYLEQL